MPETSWFRAGFLHNLGTVASSAVDSRGNLLGNGGREQASSITRTSTAPRSSSENWVSQWANRAPRNSTSANTDGRKAKKSSTKQGKHGMSDDGRNPDPSTMVKESLRSSSTADREFDRNRIMEPTDEQASRQSSMSDTLGSRSSNGTWCCVDRPHERGRLRNEENIAALIMKKRRMETEEDSYDSLWLLQSQEEHQVDRMQGILSSVDSPTNPLTDPPRQRKKCRRHLDWKTIVLAN
jgi:hypothetical protein